MEESTELQGLDHARWFKEDDYKGSHVVYGSVFLPYLSSLIAEDEDRQELRHAFDFIEMLASSSDGSIQDLVVTTILEGIMGPKEAYLKARKYMGPKTRAFATEVAKWKTWGQDNDVPHDVDFSQR